MTGILENLKLGSLLGSESINLRSIGGYQNYQQVAGPLGIWPFPVLNALQSRRR